MLKMMPSTFAGYGLISWLKTRGKIGEKAHSPTLIFFDGHFVNLEKGLAPSGFELDMSVNE